MSCSFAVIAEPKAGQDLEHHVSEVAFELHAATYIIVDNHYHVTLTGDTVWTDDALMKP